MSDTAYFTKSIVVLVCLCAWCLTAELSASEAPIPDNQIDALAAKTEYTAVEAQAAIETVKQIRAELGQDIRTTHDILLSLQEKAMGHFQTLSDLLDSEQGKILAQDPNRSGYATYLHLQDEPAVTVDEIIAKQRRLLYLQRQISLGTDPEFDVGYLPKKEIRDEITTLRKWAEDTQEAFDRQVAALNQLLRWKPTRQLDVSEGPTLDQKVEERKGKWDRILGILRLMAEDEVRPEVRQLLLEVYKDIEFEEGQLRAEIMKDREDLALARQRQRHEIEMQDDAFLLERTRRLADEEFKRRQDELDAKERELQALRALDKAMTDKKLNILETTTARQQLIAKAESPDVQMLLRPFITPGYWQPNKARTGYRRTGISWTLIQQKRCLYPTPNGLKRLLALGRNSANEERGPWGYPKELAKLKDEQREQLQRAQEYLIELGPTLVELGYLAP